MDLKKCLEWTLTMKLIKNALRSKIKEFSIFPNFAVKHKAYELTYDCFFIFQQYSQYRTYVENFDLLAWMNQKLLPKKIKKNLS